MPKKINYSILIKKIKKQTKKIIFFQTKKFTFF